MGFDRVLSGQGTGILLCAWGVFRCSGSLLFSQCYPKIRWRLVMEPIEMSGSDKEYPYAMARLYWSRIQICISKHLIPYTGGIRPKK